MWCGGESQGKGETRGKWDCKMREKEKEERSEIISDEANSFHRNVSMAPWSSSLRDNHLHNPEKSGWWINGSRVNESLQVNHYEWITVKMLTSIESVTNALSSSILKVAGYSEKLKKWIATLALMHLPICSVFSWNVSEREMNKSYKYNCFSVTVMFLRIHFEWIVIQCCKTAVTAWVTLNAQEFVTSWSIFHSNPLSPVCPFNWINCEAFVSKWTDDDETQSTYIRWREASVSRAPSVLHNKSRE